ncbi:MAG: HlyD family efflux transporter periplasmic adaptor subunit, partial [Planctomycetaceae bacterium]|nr:HlyD family efflux transporter periplasmic adaptor subunit [Planctomycetaceae bacterium]
EFALLEMLDGRASIEEICERFEQKFAPQRIRPAELQQLLANFHRSRLVIADAAGQGEQLLARRHEQQRKAILSTLGNLLAIRFKGIDPDRFLTWLDARCGWFFSVPAGVCSAALILSAVALLAAEFDVLRSRLPEFEAFFAAQNWLLLALALAGTKVLHEIGHGLACKRFGGECHEMGLMMLVGTPCLYCNVTDAWMIPNKWQRAVVGAAGMYVELNLAAIATFVWWFSQPGLVNHLCLNVMFVSSVSTLLFNGNPLLRYDGYYILSDLLEIPNLRQKSAAVIQGTLGRWLLGISPRRDPFLPTRHRWAFALYAVASSVYGWLISLSIFWFLYRVLQPYGLEILGQMLGVTMIVSLIIVPVVRLVNFLFQPARADSMNKMRASVGVGIAVATLASVLAVPLPYYVTCSVELAPRGAASVYVDVPGQVRTVHVRFGPVQPGQPIVELDDVDARLVEQRLAGQRDQLATRVESIRQRAHTDDQALLELTHVEEALNALEIQLARRRDELARLTVQASVAGMLVPPPSRAAPAGDATRLAAWSGRPLDVRNIGAHLEASTLLGQIVQPGQLEAILAVPQEEMDYVREGQRVEMLLHHLPGEKLAGQIDRIAAEELKAASNRLSTRGGGQLATRTTAEGYEKPLGVVYQASVPLDDESGRLVLGGTGIAKVHAGWQPLATRLWRSACRTFRFEM